MNVELQVDGQEYGLLLCDDSNNSIIIIYCLLYRIKHTVGPFDIIAKEMFFFFSSFIWNFNVCLLSSQWQKAANTL